MTASEKKSNEKSKDEESKGEVKIEDLESLKKALEEEKKKADDYLNRLKYLQADFENYRKRMEKEKAEILTREKTRLITRLLVVLDELELAIKNGKNAQDKVTLVEGVEMVYNKFQKLLFEEGLCEIEALGKPFNPQFHEAALVVQTDAHPNNTIIEELRKGFMVDGKVVRPSSVKVTKKPTSVDANQNETNKN